ncbi:GLPGLI family protein [Flavobacterium sp. NKUCC04_CG]|uniref:GLPGLI family protein n=1 Tax=Flavobacterium sp. NKUCC04_CG TaxID=2842121 RepID=UPI001C5A7A2A|nr:GLPGLI family protein [Flavobacterium sp. NKUCC04_CG]MBW3518293.1 GLPGLI family protein [Flavobacterium sp. NKUCC04_CG]
MLKIIFIGFCLASVCQGFAQTQRFIYQTTYKPDSLKNALISESNALDIVGQNSVYYNYTKVGAKGEEKVVESGNVKEGAEAAYLTYYVFKDKGKTEFFVYKGENAYQYEEKEKIKWQIKDSIIDYKGLFQAQLAETDFGGRKWQVFFTTQIPISNGPYKFGGLPGLIVKAVSTDLDYSIELMEVLQVKDRLLEKPDNVMTLSRSKYLSLMNEHVKDPSKDIKTIFARYGVGMSHDVSIGDVMMKPAEMFKITNQKAWEWMKTHNNPLEKGDVWLIFAPMKIVLPE